ncbi:SDR family oxidoreductase [Terriglobus aquaticus]|uniref:SDR family oxidoreductase n=1 Tax=Terriglobus aquaticus TaxID=940139 RepID=A0ABW9KQ29_9BACT|nr:SDR family NAD(P)-dependent oxidoreductase [Terriglobus aquaticus]
MNASGNVILITGGGTGIGRGLAEAFQKDGNEVIIAGRRQSVLEDTVKANPGMHFVTLDVEDAADVQRFAAEVKERFPRLNVLINNAGIMKTEDLTAGEKDLATAEQTVAINLLGTFRVTAALMPLLLQQGQATIMTVTSGLAFMPIHPNPSYCATKAAIHSWSQSLRYQLRDKGVEVLEIVPPYVQTELTGPFQAADPNAMPLAEYISETMELLKNPPASGEILVERVRGRRFAEQSGTYDQLFAEWNDYAAKRLIERAKAGQE